jgi:hypothetical protein
MVAKPKAVKDKTARLCLNAIRKADKKVDGPLTKAKYKENSDGPGHWTINNKFGSWNKAKKRAGVEVVDPRKGLSANYSYFSKVTTAEQAYWVGFIYGDGCIAPNGNGNLGLFFNLNKRDRHILEDFRDTINAKHSISESGNEVSIGFVNEEITNDLKNLGANEAKTYTDTLPDFEKESLKSAFIRGLGDADGHPERSRYSITGANRKRFEKLSEWLPVNANIITYYENKHRLRVTKMNRVKKLRKWMYPDGRKTTPSLSRKLRKMFGFNFDG